MDWYPWNFMLYKTDTMHLNPYQDGCYRRLIDHYMQTRQALPDNDAALARIVGDTVENWVAMAAPIVRPFFDAKDGRLFLKRCEINLAQQDRLTRKLSESGKNGANKRWNKINNNDSPPIAPLMGSDSIGQDKDRKKKEKPHKPLFEIPDWIAPEDWSDYSDMRQKIRKPMTDRAKKLAIATLEKLKAEGHDPKAVLQQSVFNSWQGLFAPKGTSNENASGQPSYSERLKAAGDAAERTFRARRPDLFDDEDDEKTGQGTLLQLAEPDNTIL